MTLSGKTAVVTGGSRGIGRAIVEELVGRGAQVVFSYQANKAAADELVEALGDAVRAVPADQADLDTLDALFAPVADGFDILVNNAAINPGAAIADLTPVEFDRVLTVNTKWPLFAMQRAATLLRDQGRIVSVSTLNTVIPAPGHSLYCASKGALEQLTAVAARELGPRGITVNTVSPGTTDTDLFRDTNPPGAAEQTAAFTALGRIGQPVDVARVVAWLAGPDAGWVTGQNIRATGGLLV
ncbi:SDR family oxidoreductase [Cryptosporangium aurantiacum]|uniref:3-oxoacyl-[acyl-carrier protein] reductase n=1 Tax=Cryptosporangium aurantiacum TaxID=134849 RepID=A0A1M7KVU3_9ACTN|nr:SDR family oxidoreductase [Cryptosporangium aurantiacum]SHM69598.1 3-oxoacyl-[acyl-carrier protein] reductase [Cryptosporangium aurantiacum]